MPRAPWILPGGAPAAPQLREPSPSATGSAHGARPTGRERLRELLRSEPAHHAGAAPTEDHRAGAAPTEDHGETGMLLSFRSDLGVWGFLLQVRSATGWVPCHVHGKGQEQ